MKVIKDNSKGDSEVNWEFGLDTIEENIRKNDSVSYIETKYPQMAAEFKKICSEQYELFCQKQSNYGPSNISVGTNLKTKDDIKLSLTGLWFRMNDKIQRLKNLVVLGKADTVGESIDDSFQDVSNYGIIAQLVSRGKWAK